MNNDSSNKVLAKQVDLIFKLLPIGFAATIINSFIVYVFLRTLVPGIVLLCWLTVQVFFAVLRIALYALFVIDTLKFKHVKSRERLFTAFLFTSGLIWGASAFFGFFHDSIPHQMIIALVLGGMGAGSAAIYSALRKTYYSFIIPVLLPQIVVFCVLGTSLNLAMAGMFLLFGVLISFTAETNHKIISSNYRLYLNNENLITHLKNLNTKAQTEINRRIQVENELRRSQATLEQKVNERTTALSEINDNLKTQIKKRVYIENALKESEIYYRSIVETAQEGIWVIDENHRISYANNRIAQMLGYDQEELIGKDICDFLDSSEKMFHGTDRRVRGIRQKNLRGINGVIIPVIEAENLLSDRGKMHKIRLGMITDITERKKWELEIIDLNNRLNETNSELTEFSHSVSHDIRSPLHVIESFCGLLEQEYKEKLDENAINYLSVIKNSSVRIKNIINDLLTLSRISKTELKKEIINLSAIAEDILNSLQNRSPFRSVSIEINKNLSASCDPGLIRIALENLLNNAWKFTGNNPETEISFDSFFSDHNQVFYIKDNDAGFDMKYKEKLFKPFQRLHSTSQFKGTGVGLATVYRIIKKHDGEIWAESQPGKGSTFYFTL
ncbi:MAG: PAS domain S-box protein [Fibrobacter sp.]|nr:PAS domain S-box protein [Fibrobacter sp.]